MKSRKHPLEPAYRFCAHCGREFRVTEDPRTAWCHRYCDRVCSDRAGHARRREHDNARSLAFQRNHGPWYHREAERRQGEQWQCVFRYFPERNK